MILPFKDIESVGKEKGFTSLGYAGVVVMIKGREEIFFEFAKDVARDDFALTMIHVLDAVDPSKQLRLIEPSDQHSAATARSEHEQLQRARRHSKQNSPTSESFPGAEETSELRQ